MTEHVTVARETQSQVLDQPDPGILRRLILAILSVWVYSLSGVVIGWLCVVAAKRLEASHAYPILATLFEHLGMGFIVAAIAVLFYEWGAHIKDSMELSKRTLRLSEELSALKNAVGENALDGALRVLIRGEKPEYDDDLIQSIESITDHLRKLHSDGDWAKYGYARFVSRLLKDVVASAENLQRISGELRGHSAADVAYTVKVKTPSELTDMMLAEQMQRLPAGGQYSTASNPVAWQSAQLKELHNQTSYAVQRGVAIRRIFVLSDERGPHGYPFDPDEAERTIRSHFRQSQEWRSDHGGTYEIRLFDTAAVVKADRKAKDFITLNHYGVFEMPRSDHAVLVQVNRPNLSNLSIAGLTPESDHIVLWNAVWEALPITSEDLIKESMDRRRAASPRA